MISYRLIYDMDDLGKKVFEFQAEFPFAIPTHLYPHAEVDDLIARNPPGPTVQMIYLQTPNGVFPFRNSNFNREVYDEAVKNKKWKEGYFQRTGKHWQESDKQKTSPEAPPDIDSEAIDLDDNACLKLFGLKPQFTESELKKAYRIAAKQNHPDKVATLSIEFKLLAERRTKQINQAYSKLLKKKSP